MYLGVISDTHGCDELVKSALSICREYRVSRILHCGDIGTRRVVDLLSEFPTDYVFGNCDSCLTMTLGEEIQTTGGIIHGMFGSLELEGVRIAFMHGANEKQLWQEIYSGRWDLVCRGHTHRHSLEEYKVPEENRTLDSRETTLVLNPGGIQERSEPPGFCIVKLPELEIDRISL